MINIREEFLLIARATEEVLENLYQKYNLLIKDLTTSEDINYTDLIKVFCCLGNLFSRKAEFSGNPEHYTDSAKYWQYVGSLVKTKVKSTDFNIAQSSVQDIDSYEKKANQALELINGKLIEIITDAKCDHPILREQTTRDKEFFQKLRDQVKVEIKTIDEQLKSIEEQEDANDSNIKGKFIESTKKLFAEITTSMKDFLAQCYSEAEKILGPSPCIYSVIGLGSMALQQITPYSDLEFAILTAENPDPNHGGDLKIKQYFINLTHLVHFRVINLGETPISASKHGVDLAPFIKVGVNFDLGGKTPLGRIGKDKPYCLIQNIEGMLHYLKNENFGSVHRDKALPWIIENSCHVFGCNVLTKNYQKGINTVLQKENEEGKKVYKARALHRLYENSIEQDYLGVAAPSSLKGNIDTYKPHIDYIKQSGQVFNIKQELYRLADRYLYDFLMFHGIYNINIWDGLSRLKKPFNEDCVRNLQFILSFASILRLVIYSEHSQQKDLYEISSLKKEDQINLLKVNHERNSYLFQYYYVTIPFYEYLKDIKKKPSIAEGEQFYKSGNDICAIICIRLGNLVLAEKYITLFLKEDKDPELWFYGKAIAVYTKLRMFDKAKHIIDLTKEKVPIAQRFAFDADVGFFYESKEEYNLALECYYSALQQTSEHTINRANMLLQIGNVLYKDICVEQAITILQQAKTIYDDFGKKDEEYSFILNGLGVAYSICKKYEEAKKYLKEAICLLHPDYKNSYLGNTLVNLGNALFFLNEIDESISYNEKALKLGEELEDYEIIFGALIGLGNALFGKKDFTSAINIYKKALVILNEENNPIERDYAIVYKNLAKCFIEKQMFYESALLLQKELDYSKPSDPVYQDLKDRLEKLDIILETERKILSANANNMYENHAHFIYKILDCRNIEERVLKTYLSSLPDAVYELMDEQYLILLTSRDIEVLARVNQRPKKEEFFISLIHGLDNQEKLSKAANTVEELKIDENVTSIRELNVQACKRYSDKDYVNASQLFYSLIHNPEVTSVQDLAIFHYNYGRSLFFLEKYDEAKEALKQSLQLKEAHSFNTTSIEKTQKAIEECKVKIEEAKHLNSVNCALQEFYGEKSRIDCRKFESWYSPQILEYLTYFASPNIINVIFLDGKPFFESLCELQVLVSSLGISRAGFIAKEPGAGNNHFIYGQIVFQKLLIVNPTGHTVHKDFYGILRDVNKQLFADGIYISNTVLQKDPSSLISCGPICAELMMHFSKVSDEVLRKIFANSNSVAYQISEVSSFNYHSLSVEESLSSTLRNVVEAKESEYTERLIEIRSSHETLLQNIPGNTEEQNKLLSNRLNQEQTLLLLLLDKKMTFISIQEKSEYKALVQRITNKSDDKSYLTDDKVIDITRKYSDADISFLVKTAIKKMKGGFLSTKDGDCDYLLAKKYPIGEMSNEECHVVVCDALDHVGSGIPREFFFDKTFQQAPDHGNRDDRKDIFDEIIPLIFNKEGDVNVKILFPYNILQHHWLTGEVFLQKVQGAGNEPGKVSIIFNCHDPFGGGKPTESSFNAITNAIRNILIIHQYEIEVIPNTDSSFMGRRQAVGDGVSCGVIVVDEILKRIKGQPLDVDTPHQIGALELRKQQLEIAKSLPETDASRHNFERANLQTKKRFKIDKKITVNDVVKAVLDLESSLLKEDALSMFKCLNVRIDIDLALVQVKSFFEDRPMQFLSEINIGFSSEDLDRIAIIALFFSREDINNSAKISVIKEIQSNKFTPEESTVANIMDTHIDIIETRSRIKKIEENYYIYNRKDIKKILESISKPKFLHLTIKEVTKTQYLQEYVTFVEKIYLELKTKDRKEENSSIFLTSLLQEDTNEWSSIAIFVLNDKTHIVINGLDVETITAIRKISYQDTEIIVPQSHLYSSGISVIGGIKRLIDVYIYFIQYATRKEFNLNHKLGDLTKFLTDTELDLIKIDCKEAYYSNLLQSLFFKTRKEAMEDLVSVFMSLGSIYIGKAILTKNPEHYTDAAKFYQYVLSINNDDWLQTKSIDQISEAYTKLNFIKDKLVSLIGGDVNKLRFDFIQDESSADKQELEQLRKTVKQRSEEALDHLEKIGDILSETEIKLATNESRDLFTYIADSMKNFLARIIEESEKVLGPPPCTYAVVGLGSMALQQITPYSDLEFAILIAKDNENEKKYFRNLSHLVHFRIINLGETIIPTSKYGIDLARFIKVGVNFDLGGKTPLGRIDKDKPYDLIQTVHGMLKDLKNQNNRTVRIDKALPWILESTSYICGDVGLLKDYQEQAKKFLTHHSAEGIQNCAYRALKRLKETSFEYDYLHISSPGSLKGNLGAFTPATSWIENNAAPILQTKQDIYRLPDRLIYDLTRLYGIQESNMWDGIAKFEEIGESNKNCLLYIISFANLLRLRAYSFYGSQNENFSLSTVMTDLFCLSDTSLEKDGSLFKYYYIAEPLHDILQEFTENFETLSSEERKSFLSTKSFYNRSNVIIASIYKRLLNNTNAKSHLFLALEEEPDNLRTITMIIGILESELQYDEMLVYCEKGIHLAQDHSGFQSYFCYKKAVVYGQTGKNDESKELFKKIISLDHEFVLEAYLNLALLYSQDTSSERSQLEFLIDKAYERGPSNSIDNAVFLLQISSAQINIQLYKEALHNLNAALHVAYKLSHAQGSPILIKILERISYALYESGNYTESIKYALQAEQMVKHLYNENVNQVSIGIYHLLAANNAKLGKFSLAKKYIEDISNLNVDYGQCKLDHFRTLLNTALLKAELGEFDVPLFSKIHNMIDKIYPNKKSKEHAILFYNKAVLYKKNGFPVKALEDFEKAEKIQKSPLLKAELYLEMGNCYMYMRNYNKSQEYTNLVLESLRDSPQFGVALRLRYLAENNLALFYMETQNLDKALSGFKRSLDLVSKFDGDQLNDKVTILFNIAEIYNRQKKLPDAKSGFQECLNILERSSDDILKAKIQMNLAMVHEKLEEYELALENYDNSLKTMIPAYQYQLHPKVGLIYLNLAMLFKSFQQYAEAISFANEAMKNAEAKLDYILSSRIQEFYQDLIATFAKGYNINEEQTLSLLKYIRKLQPFNGAVLMSNTMFFTALSNLLRSQLLGKQKHSEEYKQSFIDYVTAANLAVIYAKNQYNDDKNAELEDLLILTYNNFADACYEYTEYFRSVNNNEQFQYYMNKSMFVFQSAYAVIQESSNPGKSRVILTELANFLINRKDYDSAYNFLMQVVIQQDYGGVIENDILSVDILDERLKHSITKVNQTIYFYNKNYAQYLLIMNAHSFNIDLNDAVQTLEIFLKDRAKSGCYLLLSQAYSKVGNTEQSESYYSKFEEMLNIEKEHNESEKEETIIQCIESVIRNEIPSVFFNSDAAVKISIKTDKEDKIVLVTYNAPEGSEVQKGDLARKLGETFIRLAKEKLNQQAELYDAAESEANSTCINVSTEQALPKTQVFYFHINYNNYLLNSKHGNRLLVKAYQLGGNSLFNLLMNLGREQHISEEILSAINVESEEIVLYRLLSREVLRKEFTVKTVDHQYKSFVAYVDKDTGAFLSIEENKNPVLRLDTEYNIDFSFYKFLSMLSGSTRTNIEYITQETINLIQRIINTSIPEQQSDKQTSILLFLFDLLDNLDSSYTYIPLPPPKKDPDFDPGDFGGFNNNSPDYPSEPSIFITGENNVTRGE